MTGGFKGEIDVAVKWVHLNRPRALDLYYCTREAKFIYDN